MHAPANTMLRRQHHHHHRRTPFSGGSSAAAAAAPRAATRPVRLSRASIVALAASQTSLELFSPSKVNLFLRVVRRREDGYHDLASLFHVIDLGDDMRFELLPAGSGATRDELVCSDPTIPHDERNLVIKALNLFRAKTGRADLFFRVALEKRVPHGAGLGGGSGNAATTLYAANELAGRPASNAELLAWGGDIGSDISVFFSRGAAYCTGRGEVVEDVAPPLPLGTPLLLVKPPVGLSTPAIFKALDLNRRSTQDPRALLARLGERGRIAPDLCVNDLEQPAFDSLPELAALKRRLAEAGPGSSGSSGSGSSGSSGGYDAVFMTGSGSTIVCVGSDVPPAFLAEDGGGGELPWGSGELFVSAARLITRQEGGWYAAPSRGGGSSSGAAGAAAAGAPAAAAAGAAAAKA